MVLALAFIVPAVAAALKFIIIGLKKYIASIIDKTILFGNRGKEYAAVFIKVLDICAVFKSAGNPFIIAGFDFRRGGLAGHCGIIIAFVLFAV